MEFMVALQGRRIVAAESAPRFGILRIFFADANYTEILDCFSGKPACWRVRKQASRLAGLPAFLIRNRLSLCA